MDLTYIWVGKKEFKVLFLKKNLVGWVWRKVGLISVFRKKILVKIGLISVGLCKIGWKWIVKKHLVALEINENVFGKKILKRKPKLGFKVSRKRFC